VIEYTYAKPACTLNICQQCSFMFNNRHLNQEIHRLALSHSLYKCPAYLYSVFCAINLRLNIRLKGYVYRQHLYIVRQGNRSSTILPLEVFTQKKQCSGHYSTELEFYSQKRQIRVLSNPLEKLGVTNALHL